MASTILNFYWPSAIDNILCYDKPLSFLFENAIRGCDGEERITCGFLSLLAPCTFVQTLTVLTLAVFLVAD